MTCLYPSVCLSLCLSVCLSVCMSLGMSLSSCALPHAPGTSFGYHHRDERAGETRRDKKKQQIERKTHRQTIQPRTWVIFCFVSVSCLAYSYHPTNPHRRQSAPYTHAHQQTPPFAAASARAATYSRYEDARLANTRSRLTPPSGIMVSFTWVKGLSRTPDSYSCS